MFGTWATSTTTSGIATASTSRTPRRRSPIPTSDTRNRLDRMHSAQKSSPPAITPTSPSPGGTRPIIMPRTVSVVAVPPGPTKAAAASPAARSRLLSGSRANLTGSMAASLPAIVMGPRSHVRYTAPRVIGRTMASSSGSMMRRKLPPTRPSRPAVAAQIRPSTVPIVVPMLPVLKPARKRASLRRRNRPTTRASLRRRREHPRARRTGPPAPSPVVRRRSARP